MGIGRDARRWLGREKGRRTILAGVVLLIALFGLAAYLMRPGRKLWHIVSAQETYRTCRLKQGQYCSEARDPRRINYYDFATVCYSREFAPSYESLLFEQNLKFILYGEVEGIKNYVIEGDAVRDGKKVKPVPYYCHVITVRIRRGIYGGLEENQRVNLLCRWKYEERDESIESEGEYVEKGKNAIFLVAGNAARIEDQERGERIDILGRVPNERGSRLVECKEWKNLDSIGSKEEAVAFYLKHRIVTKPSK